MTLLSFFHPTTGVEYENLQGFKCLCVIFVFFLLRNTSPLMRNIWDIFKLVLFIIFIILTAGVAVKWLKKIF